MLILIVSILLLGVIVAIASKVASRGKNVEDAPIKVEQTCATCNGTPETKCEQDCMMEASTKPIEYFDDEELDVFSGRTSDSYTDDEADQFSDVLYTMRQDEVAAWCRSLHLRGIELPDQIKDEVYMLRAQTHSPEQVHLFQAVFPSEIGRDVIEAQSNAMLDSILVQALDLLEWG